MLRSLAALGGVKQHELPEPIRIPRPYGTEEPEREQLASVTEIRSFFQR